MAKIIDKEKYEKLYEKVDNRNKIILYLLGRKEMPVDELCQLRLADINQQGIQDIKLPRREQIVLVQYLRNRTMESLEDPLFPSRSKDEKFLTPKKLKTSFSLLCSKAGIKPIEIGVSFISEDVEEEEINMGTILDIIQKKTAKERKKEKI